MINTEYINIIATALADETGITIKAGSKWSSNIKKRELIYDTSDLITLDTELAKGLLIHEVGHLKYTTDDGSLTQMEKDYPEESHRIANAFEDMRIKKCLVKSLGDFSRYPLEYLDEYCTKLNLVRGRDDFKNQPKCDQVGFLALTSKLAETNDHICQLVGWGSLSYLLVENSQVATFSPDVIEILSKNIKEFRDIIYRAVNCDTTDEMIQVLDRELYPIIKPLLEDDKQNNRVQKKQGNVRVTGGQGQGGNSTLDDLKKAMQTGKTPSKMGCKKKETIIPSEADAKIKFLARARVLGKHIADILEERRANKWTGNHKQGRLLSKNVYKVMTNDTNIFSRKLNNLPDKYIFYIGLDCSGSMDSDKRDYNAVMSGYILKFAIDKTGLPLKIYAYDDLSHPLKKMSDYRTGGGTNDYYTIKDILKDGKQYPDYEKIVMMITDGDPNRGDDRDELLKLITKDKSYLLSVIGISLSDRGMEHLKDNYKGWECLNVQKPDDLPNAVIKIISNLIKR